MSYGYSTVDFIIISLIYRLKIVHDIHVEKTATHSTDTQISQRTKLSTVLTRRAQKDTHDTEVSPTTSKLVYEIKSSFQQL